MAAKTPDTVFTSNIGNLKMTIANFSTAGSLDDDDTWASGIKSAVFYICSSTIDGPQDLTIDAYDATTGTFTFGAADNQTGFVMVLSRDY
jgi:hypothetical protein